MEAEPVTPARQSLKRSLLFTEDSGYHTSFTPGSFDCVETPNENLDPELLSQAPLRNHHDKGLQLTSSPRRKYARLKGSTSICFDNTPSSPSYRRGRKRHFQDDSAIDNLESLPTPTRYIARGIAHLHVSDASDYNLVSTPFPLSIQQNNIYSIGEYSYPTTPLKKVCKSNVNKLSPHKSSHKSSPLRPLNETCPPKHVKKLIYNDQLSSIKTLHFSLEKHDKPHKVILPPKPVRSCFKPEQKVDIIKMLHKKGIPVMDKIFSYLDSEDIFNFSMVSSIWLLACEEVSKAAYRRKTYMEFINNTKENSESRNKEKGSEATHIDYEKSASSLKDINNIVNTRKIISSPKRSPPGTPRTRRFKKFTKAASLDSRKQIVCIRCRQPAKVTEETSGEEWAECLNSTCAFQFCKFCTCQRHPGKKCFQYDLEGPSPSKRKKSNYAIGTMKSRKNLRRLF